MSNRPQQVCDTCHTPKGLMAFYKDRHGEYCPTCKKCLLKNVDNADPSTFVPILKRLDYPYIADVWASLARAQYRASPSSFGPSSVFGKYVRTMCMDQYKPFTFADSEELNGSKHLPKVDRDDDDANSELPFDDFHVADVAWGDASSDSDSSSEEDAVRESYDDEEWGRLVRRWGDSYKPSELRAMDELFRKYESDYKLDTIDRMETAKQICKVMIKMNDALDHDDFQSYRSLSQVADSLRKSGAFTEAQKKTEQKRYLDSVGELVAAAERSGGIIEQYPMLDDYPQDKIDLTLRDYENYVYNLVSNEMGLGDIIETYVKKLDEIKEGDRKPLAEGLVTSSAEEQDAPEQDIDYQRYVQTEMSKGDYGLDDETFSYVPESERGED